MSTGQRLPVPGSDNGDWGDILNSFLEVSLDNDGTIKPSAITEAGGVLSSQIGQNSGVAGLNSSGLVPSSQLATGEADTSSYLRGDGTWAAVTGTPGPAGVAGPAGPTGATGPAMSSNIASYYSNGSIGGTGLMEFNSQAINIGSAIDVEGYIIWLFEPGTYLLSASAIAQTYDYEGGSELTFSVGLEEGDGEIPVSNISPYPLSEYSAYSNPEQGGNQSVATISASQMVTVSNTPASFFFNVWQVGGNSLEISNAALNVIKLD